MIAAVLAVLLSGPAAAAPAASAGAPRPGPTYWFKTYSTAPYKEFWTAELDVKDLALDLPKALQAIDKAGGKLTQPLRNFVSSTTDQSQQLSFTIALKGAKSLLKPLRKVGRMADPAVRPAGEPIPAAEVKAKIDLLMKEKRERSAELAKVPATAAAAEEILEHLLLVEEIAERTDAEVHFDLTVIRK